ncbi:hypothetical protein MTO96_051010 [Rhipicephalus appendiculatus]
MLRLLLVFVMSHCFTGGYTSFLNIPIMEEAPDTKEKLLAFLRDGRLEPCIVKTLMLHVYSTRSKHPSVASWMNAVQNWSHFASSSMETCVEKTRQRKAVHLGPSGFLEHYIASYPGQIEISWVIADELMFPVSLLLPKASPYQEVLDNV